MYKRVNTTSASMNIDLKAKHLFSSTRYFKGWMCLF